MEVLSDVGPIANFTAIQGDGQIQLNWTNPGGTFTNGNLLSRVSLKGSPTNTTPGLSLEILGEETDSGTSALYTYDVFNNMIGVLEGNN